jgi:uncharacterized protein (TIGR02246 family)
MRDHLEAAERTAIEAIVRSMEAAWNCGDAAAFAAPFAEDADFVNVNGFHPRGRDTIARGHDGIFKSVYAGSEVSYAIESARHLAENVVLIHVHAALNVPAGPMAGAHEARWSAVLTRDGERWEIASLHNTMLQDVNRATDVDERLRSDRVASDD